MLLEYADNGNLYHYLKKHGGKGLDPEKISSMYIQIFDAVKFMHDNEILHSVLDMLFLPFVRTNDILMD